MSGVAPGTPPATTAAGTRRMVGSVLAVLLIVLASACGTSRDDGDPAARRGEVVSVTALSTMTDAETAAYLGERQLETPVRNGVETYRIVYRTVGPLGEETTASGLMVLPRTETERLRVVSYAHGTIVRKDEAPSADGETDRARAIMFAAVGNAAVAPDYLGLGEGPGRHPYAHAPTEASASLDLLRAARDAAAERGRTLESDVYIVGFSQGGQAATALGRELHDNPGTGFRGAALSAISGPYAIREAQTPAALDGGVSPRSAVVYLAYWLTAMNPIYGLYDHPTEAFRQPYADRVESLFDGYHDVLSVGTGLPAAPAELLTDRFLAWARQPTGPALRAVTESDGTCEWTTDAPVRLYVSTADRSVAAANTDHCLRSLRGPRVERVDLSPMDHGATGRAGLVQTLAWFDQLVPVG